tara:strand:+ start:2073 stop:2420 length:348 start_codon:yes stop_codon:yes gene_type:complete
MRIKKIHPPRTFQVGKKRNKIFLKDTVHIKISEKEKIFLPLPNNSPLKFEFKKWGFILENNIKKNKKNINYKFFGTNSRKMHLICYFKKFEKKFYKYCKDENLKIVNINKFINEI